MDWFDFLRAMKVDERAARSKYRMAARIAKNAAIEEVFTKLAHEEEVHIGVLEKFERDLKALLAKERGRKG